MQIVCYIGINNYLCSVIKIKQLINKKITAMKTKTTNKEIKKQFESMRCAPMFEIDLHDYIDTLDEDQDQYVYCYINYNEQTNMLQYGGCSNSGFICRYEIEYDKDFSIDENLENLLNLFIENSIKDYQNEN